MRQGIQKSRHVAPNPNREKPKCEKLGPVPRVCPRCEARYHDEAIFCQVDGVRLASEEQAPDPYIGMDLMNQFRIEEAIGEGGMGRVYRAHQPSLDRNVAVKILHRELADNNPDATRRFHREARVTTALDHPNVVNVFMFGEMPDSSPYLVMEYLDGQPLHLLLERESPLDMGRALHIAIQVSEGVGQAHERGIVHRDVKPENVLIVTRGSDPNFVKVLDFGIARLLWDKETVATKAGLVFGTARYISPEGASGDATDARSDVYSIAILTYQLLTGRVPFEGDAAVDLLLAQINERPPELRSVLPAVPEPVARVVMRGLSKDPRRRPDNAQAFADALRDAADEAGLRSSGRRSRGFTPVPDWPTGLAPQLPKAKVETLDTQRAAARQASHRVPTIPGLRRGVWLRRLGIALLLIGFFGLGAGAVLGGAWVAGAFEPQIRQGMPPVDRSGAFDLPSPVERAVEATPLSTGEAPRSAVTLFPAEPRSGQPVALVATIAPGTQVTMDARPQFRVFRRGRPSGGPILAERGPDHTWVASHVFRRGGAHEVRFYLREDAAPMISEVAEVEYTTRRRGRGAPPPEVVPVLHRERRDEPRLANPRAARETQAPEPRVAEEPSFPPLRAEPPTLHEPMDPPREVSPATPPAPAEPWPGAGEARPWVDSTGGAIL